MRVADVDLILIPGYMPAENSTAADPDHWMSRWERNLASARWLDYGDGKAGESAADRNDRATALLAQAGRIRRPVIVVTHGTGVEVLLAAGEMLSARPVVGAFVVAPVVRAEALRQIAPGALPLDFPSVGIVPDNNQAFRVEEGQRLIESMGGHLVLAGSTGPLDHTSGHGPWPEGLMRLGWFLKKIRTDGVTANRRDGNGQ